MDFGVAQARYDDILAARHERELDSLFDDPDVDEDEDEDLEPDDEDYDPDLDDDEDDEEDN